MSIFNLYSNEVENIDDKHGVNLHTINTKLISPDLYWDTHQSWSEAQASLDHLLQIRLSKKSCILFLAKSIAEKINFLEPALNALCSKTCPVCTNPCCERATVRYDFRDLIYLHTLQKGLPISQPKPDPGKKCYMLGQNGCILHRYMRPFICTWYLCPQQMDLVRHAQSGDVYHLPKQLGVIQNKRKQLETLFLDKVYS